jgi:AcrR family transcriptional regulator
MSEATRDALDAFLGLIAERGYAAVTLRDVAQASGLRLAELYRQYPDKTALVAAFLARVDAEVLAGTPAGLDPEETARDRLFDVMMRRYDALNACRAAWRAVRAAVQRDPILALTLAPAIRRSMAAMLEAAGIASDGLSGAVRQNGLAAVYWDVSRTFDKDESVDLSKTMAALDGRLKTVESWAQSIEKYGQFPKRRDRAAETQTPAA